MTVEDGQALPDYRSGQYVALRVFVPELGYSLSGMPRAGYLYISVKREDTYAEGQDPSYVSSTLHNVVSEGDTVDLSAPAGHFFLYNPK
ncbi:hypothetical protein [[Erwinia] mediterraneensis]|uniref:hypothetical protein n=1 Tax=[Erwinia] mediterraneensis TaxID=2161819 RepID=UPI0034E249C2